MKSPAPHAQFSGNAFGVQWLATFRRAFIKNSFHPPSACRRRLPFCLVSLRDFFFQRGDDEPAAAVVRVGQGAKNLQRHFHAY